MVLASENNNPFVNFLFQHKWARVIALYGTMITAVAFLFLWGFRLDSTMAFLSYESALWLSACGISIWLNTLYFRDVGFSIRRNKMREFSFEKKMKAMDCESSIGDYWTRKLQHVAVSDEGMKLSMGLGFYGADELNDKEMENLKQRIAKDAFIRLIPGNKGNATLEITIKPQ